MKLIDVDNSAVNDIIRSSGKGKSINKSEHYYENYVAHFRGRFRLLKRRCGKPQTFRHSFLSNFFAGNKNASKSKKT